MHKQYPGDKAIDDMRVCKTEKKIMNSLIIA